MVAFSQLPAVKKDTIFGAARKFLGPSYFVTALAMEQTVCKKRYIARRIISHLFFKQTGVWFEQNKGFLARAIIVKCMTFHNFKGILTQEERVEDVGGVLYWSCPLATALLLCHYVLPASWCTL